MSEAVLPRGDGPGRGGLAGRRWSPPGSPRMRRKADLAGLVGPADVDALPVAAEAGGNPVIPLVALLRQRAREVNDEAAPLAAPRPDQPGRRRHGADALPPRGPRPGGRRAARTGRLRSSRLADEHRSTVMAGRTLTQHAVPITFGLKASGWLTGVLDAADALDGARCLAGRPGRRSRRNPGRDDRARTRRRTGRPVGRRRRDGRWTRRRARARARGRRGTPRDDRSPLVGDALVAATDAWGRIAADVATLGRPEIGELAEPVGGRSRGLVDDAAEAEPGAVRAGPARGADRTGSRPPRCTPPQRWPSTSGRTGPGTPSGRRCGPSPGRPSSPVRRPPSSSPGSGSTSTE